MQCPGNETVSSAPLKTQDDDYVRLMCAWFWEDTSPTLHARPGIIGENPAVVHYIYPCRPSTSAYITARIDTIVILPRCSSRLKTFDLRFRHRGPA